METIKRALGISGGAVPPPPTSADYQQLLAREQALQKARQGQPCTKTPLACTTESEVKLHPSKMMLALEWRGAEKVEVTPRIARAVTDPGDALIRVTSNTICGSDLHMYKNQIPGVGTMKEGDILGHEAVGVVDEVGPEVKNFRPGDRVVISAVLQCGSCSFCKSDRPSLCDHTNPSGILEQLYGHRLAGIFGYSHLTGGYSGSQAEYVRVPLADHNMLAIPSGLRDDQVLLLSDVACTAWHALELAEVKEGSNVAIWGAGPIGLAATYLALKLKKANRVVTIDKVPYRLDLARRVGASVIDFSKQDVFTELNHRLIPGGPNHCVDAAGFRFAKSAMQHLAPALAATAGLGPTDTADIVSEVMKCCNKGGFVSLIGDYFGNANEYPVGPQMEKSITVRGGQVFVQKYWRYLLSQIQSGAIDLTFLLSHRGDFERIADAYAAFDQRQDNAIKMHLRTAFGRSIEAQQQPQQAAAGAKVGEERKMPQQADVTMRS